MHIRSVTLSLQLNHKKQELKLQVMKAFYYRLKSKSRDLFAATLLMNSPFSAYSYFRNRKDGLNIGMFKSGKYKFVARKLDWVGVREVFFEDEYRILKKIDLGAENPKIVDLGSNIGGFAISAFNRWPGASVISVEAAQDTFEVLKKNREINQELDWHVVHAGVWSSDGELVLDRKDISIGHRVSDSEDGERIPSMTLDTILNNQGWNGVDLMKMDIEGAEEVVIPVIANLLKETSVLIIEVHTDRIDPANVYSVLRECFKFCWQLNDRSSSKPVLVLSNTNFPDIGMSAVDVDLLGQ